MPKVNIEDIRIALGGMKGEFFAGTMSKTPNVWKEKINVHNDVLAALIQGWENKSQTFVAEDGTQHQLIVLNNTTGNRVFNEKQVIEMLDKFRHPGSQTLTSKEFIKNYINDNPIK